MRNRSLDAVRGLAACSVVLFHCSNFFNPDSLLIRFTPIRLILSGQSAVVLFFVLSGFVLQLTFNERDRLALEPFYIKRAVRILLPFTAAVFFASCLAEIAGVAPYEGLIPWAFLENWQQMPTISLIGLHLLMTDWPVWQGLDQPMWSLVVELRMSLLFPLITFGLARSTVAFLTLSAIISLVSVLIYKNHHDQWVIDPFATLRYLLAFTAGAVLQTRSAWLESNLIKVRTAARLLLWAIALCLLSLKPIDLQIFSTVAGASLVVGLAYADRRASVFLNMSPFIWLGRVSYSLYLIHVPIILCLVHLLHTHMPILAILSIAIGLSLLMAEGLYRIVEEPSVKIGRYLARKSVRHASNKHGSTREPQTEGMNSGS